MFPFLIGTVRTIADMVNWFVTEGFHSS